MRLPRGLKIILLSAGLLFSLSCGRIPDKDIFNFPIEISAYNGLVESISPAPVSSQRMNAYSFSVYDNLFIAYERSGPGFISFSDLYSGGLHFTICPKGRGAGEFSYILPLFSEQERGLGLYDPIKSVHYLLDIAGTVSAESSRYNTIVNVESKRPWSNLFCAFFICGEDSLLVLNTKQRINKERMIDPPSFQLYNAKDGHIMREYKPYNAIHKNTRESLYSSKTFLNSFECFNAQRQTVCSVMENFPQINFFDIKNEAFSGIKIKGLPPFSYKHQMAHFLDVASDSHTIYALYGGAPYEQLPRVRSKIYVLDWDGALIRILELDKFYKSLALDKGRLFLADNDDYLFSINIED